MKKRLFILLIALGGTLLLVPSCKDDDEGFHQISQIEREIYLKINDYRSSEELNSLVEQFLLFKEGRIISEKLASGEYILGDPDALKVIDDLTQNLGGTTNSLITLTSDINNADSIVNKLIGDPSASAVLVDEYTQCGIGLSTGSDQLHYIAVILINIPN